MSSNRFEVTARQKGKEKKDQICHSVFFKVCPLMEGGHFEYALGHFQVMSDTKQIVSELSTEWYAELKKTFNILCVT